LHHTARSLLLLGLVLAGGVTGAVAGRVLELPHQIPEVARSRVQLVTDDPSLAVKVDAEPFVARRDLFEYLLDHPEFATHVTRALKLARYRIWRTPQGLGIDDGWGTIGTFELVHASEGMRLMYAHGVYQQRFLPDIRGQAVVVIDYDAQPAPNGRSQINAAVSGYVRLDSRILTLASRLATSVATAKGEKEAHRLVRLFAKTTRAIDADPPGVYEKVRQRPDVPAAELEGFRRLLRLPAAATAPRAPASVAR
jgi:hypothetical protein